VNDGLNARALTFLTENSLSVFQAFLGSDLMAKKFSALSFSASATSS